MKNVYIRKKRALKVKINGGIYYEGRPWWEEYGIKADHLYSDGTAYIDTNYTLQYSKGTTEIMCSSNEVSRTNGIYGFIERNENLANRISIGISGGWFVGSGATHRLGDAIDDSKVNIVWNRDKEIVWFNGEEIEAINILKEGNEYTAYLCSRNDNGKQDADGIYNLIGKVYYLRETLDGVVQFSYIPIQVVKEFTDLNGVTHSVGDWIMVNELLENDVPTHYGKFSGYINWWEEYGTKGLYLENIDNESYIVTDVTPVPNELSLNIECIFLNDITSAPFGCRPTGNASISSNNVFQVNNTIRVDLLGDASLSIPKENNIVYNIDYNGADNVFTINGSKYNGSVEKSSVEVEYPFAIFANNSGGILSVGSACIMRYSKFNINDKQYIPIQVIKQFIDNKGVIHNVGDWIMVNELITKEVPTHTGTFTGQQILDGSNPVIDGLTHWWDSENQSGTTWTPKIGNVNINTSDSWENGYFKKLPNNKCETAQFNVSWTNGCTFDILYNLEKFTETALNNNFDTQLWSVVNQSNQEWLLNYTRRENNDVISFYSPTLLSNNAYYTNLIPKLNTFYSNVITYNKTNFKYYNDTIKLLDETVTANTPGAIKFALNRITPENNNQSSLTKSIRIYNRELTPDEIKNNKLYDLKILNQQIDNNFYYFKSNSEQNPYYDLGKRIAYGKRIEIPISFEDTTINPYPLYGLFGSRQGYSQSTAYNTFIGRNDLPMATDVSVNLIPKDRKFTVAIEDGKGYIDGVLTTTDTAPVSDWYQNSFLYNVNTEALGGAMTTYRLPIGTRVYGCKIYDVATGVMENNYEPQLNQTLKCRITGEVLPKLGINPTDSWDIVKYSIYEELDSIEASGNQYIDTGIFGDETTELGLEFSLSNLSQQKIAGSRNAAENNNITFSYPTNASNNYFNIDYQSNINNRIDTDYPFIINDFYTAVASPTIMSIDGITQSVTNVTPFTTPTTLRICDGYGITYATKTMSGRVKRYWIKKNNILIQDCIPVKLLDNIENGNSGDIGMWDKINNKFYKSSTSTPFIGIPKTGIYEPLEYIQGNKLQYINTNIPIQNDLSWDVNCAITDFNDIYYPFGFLVGGQARSNPLGIDSGNYGTNFGYVKTISFIPLQYGVRDNNFHRFIFNDVNNGNISIDGNVVDTYVSNPDYINRFSSVYLFARNYGNANAITPMKLAYCKIWNKNKILLRDYIPVKLLTDYQGFTSGAIGLWDVVNSNFYASATSTPFIAPSIANLQTKDGFILQSKDNYILNIQ